jgi:hypothetical protein
MELKKYTAVRFNVRTPEELITAMRGLGDNVIVAPFREKADERYHVEVYLAGERIFALRAY